MQYFCRAIWRFLFASCFLLLISGCATLNKDECLNSDWRLIGYEDGSEGRGVSRIGDHRRACAKHGVTPDMTTYNIGRKEGLKIFCQPSEAYRYGLNGGNYQGVCPEEYEAAFLTAYEEGKRFYDTRARISHYRGEIRSRNSSLKINKEELSAEEKRLVGEGISEIERVQALARVKELSKEQQKLEGEIDEYEVRIAVLERELEVMKIKAQYH